MRERKRRFEIFSFYDHTGVEKHMEKMARKGWMVEKITGFGWVYRRMKPQELHFAVSFYPKASVYDPEMPEGQKSYQDLCSHTGWVLAAASGQMQIFYNEQPNPVPIETDPATEVETIHRAAKRTYLRSYFIMLICGVLELFLSLSSLAQNPVSFLSRNSSLFGLADWGMLMVLCLWELIAYYSWRSRALKAAQAGVFLETRGTSGMQKVSLAVILTGFVYWMGSSLLTASPLLRISTLGSLTWMTVLIAAVNGLRIYLKKKKVSARANAVLTTGASVLLSFLLLGGMVWGILQAEEHGLLAGKQETYQHHGRTYTVYNDDLPLTLEDLTGDAYAGYTRRKTGEASFLLGQLDYEQRPRYDLENSGELPTLEYTITQVKVPRLYEVIKQSILSSRKDEVYEDFVWKNHFEPADPAPWGALDAYRIYLNDGYLNAYLLCYETTFVRIYLDWEPNGVQMKLVGEILGK